MPNLKVRRGSSQTVSQINLAVPARIHIMGICGTAMSALAGLLQDQGYTVSGSDRSFYPPASEELKRMQIQTMQGFNRENIHSDLDLVVVGNVISKNMPETQALLESKLPYITLPEALKACVIKDKQTVMVCGTHGKTTVSSLSAWVLQEAGLNPGFLIGGLLENFKTGFRNSESRHFVIEGDEYDTAFFEKTPKFLHYPSKYTLLNNIEFDHADIYANLQEVEESFRLLLTQSSSDVIAGLDSPLVEKLLPLAKGKTYTYGIKKGEWRLTNRTPLKEGGQILKVEHPKRASVEFQIPLSGEYNALNSLAVWVLTRILNLDSTQVFKAFKSFKGVRRRFQILGTFSGCTLIEDFAHHPTAVRAVISSAREQYPSRPIVALFEPRSNTSRKNIFQKEYAQALSLADVTFCLSVPKTPDSFSAEKLVEDIHREKNVKAYSAPNIQALLSLILRQAPSDSVILIMSNGDFGGIYEMLKKELISKGK